MGAHAVITVPPGLRSSVPQVDSGILRYTDVDAVVQVCILGD